MQELLPISNELADSPGSSAEPEGWVAEQLADCPTVLVSITSLVLNESPRCAGESQEHIQTLAEVTEELPPIVVHGPTRQVIDGVHRIRAATLRGDEEIEARIYDGSLADAFVLAVKMNVSHGLPLSRTDRTAAACRIVRSHPRWSDRMIAAVAGLAPGTIAGIRRRSTAQNMQSNTRIGQDGRVRSINWTDGRLRVCQLLNQRPTASVRTIAREAGVSPSTVQDVRQRLAAGENPIPEKRKYQRMPAGESNTERIQAEDTSWLRDHGRPGTGRPGTGRPGNGADITALLSGLMKDPSMRFSDAGRFLLRWLDMNRAGLASCEQVVETVPDHCARAVATLARGFADAWVALATRLEKRCRPQSS